MFKKLRIKFIAITMVMVAVVMALAFSAVCVIEYQRSYSVVQTTLRDTVEQAVSDESQFRFAFGAIGEARQQAGTMQPGQEGEKPFKLKDGEAGAYGAAGSGNTADPSAASDAGQQAGGENATNSQPDASAAAESAVSSESTDEGNGMRTNAAPPEIGNRRNEARATNSLIPVAVYQLGADGSTRMIPQVTSASISDDVLSDALQSIPQDGQEYGTVSDLGLHYYRYVVSEKTYVAFADTSYTDGWKTLGMMLVIVGIVTLAIFFVISFFYSRWALRPVREAWDSQKQFVADASHDLKTPLTVVLANSAILLKHPERTIASESQWIESTQVEAEHMQGLVNEMLELAQIEAGEKIEIEKERLDFSDLVDGETLLFDSVALERGCAFDCQVESEINVLGNEKQIKKMVSTLIENAFKYVNDGGAVRIELVRSGKMARLAITNSGSVISPDDLPHIFDRFYRTDKARTSGAGGYGLGLAIAREIALQHGGDITCTSSESAGTTFTATLPVS